MRSDSQVEALHLGTVQPVREFRWSIDPNGAPAALAEQAAADLGLPIRGHEDDNIARGPRQFDFDAFLDDALLAPLYGHFHFEIVGEQDSAWHMVKLAPRHPRTIQEFQSNTAGDLLGIRQNIGGAQGWFRLPPPIPAGKLVTMTWRKEAGSHVGRSQLRSLYREWLVKDRTIRVAAINVERAGGMPVIEGPMGASDGQIRDLAMLARSFKVAEGGGGAIPFGSKLNLVGGHVPDAISLLKYCDECMARVWALMLVQLGMTTTGNRALGSEFALYAARAQRALAKWVCRSVNDFLDRYTEWNLGESASHAPLLHYEQAKPDSMSVTDLVSLIEAQALHVDPELESWLRNENGLPPAPAPQNDPALGDLTPEEVQLVQTSRTPPELPAPALPSPTLDPSAQEPTLAAAGPLTEISLALPDRPLHRQPNAHEIRARIDLRALDAAHQSTLEALQQLFKGQVIPAQIKDLGAQIEAGTLSKAAMAGLQAEVAGGDQIAAALLTAARTGSDAALAELAAQGVSAVNPTDAALAARVADQATAVAEMAANGLSLAAQRKAAGLIGGDRTATDVRALLETALNGMAHQWTMDQLQGAVTFAQNSGRVETFASATGTALSYYASEILDVATCGPCTDVDGTQYPDLSAAEQDYAAGGFVECAGGPRCRGTLVAVDQSAESGQGATDPLSLAA